MESKYPVVSFFSLRGSKRHTLKFDSEKPWNDAIDIQPPGIILQSIRGFSVSTAESAENPLLHVLSVDHAAGS